MKKNILKAALLCFIPMLFSSCLWFPASDEADIRTKNTCKDFSTLNDPIIIGVHSLRDFNLYGNSNVTESVRLGSSFVIYDWETDSVFDYLFVQDDTIYLSVDSIVPVIRNKNGSYSAVVQANSGKRLTEIESTGNITNKDLINGRLITSGMGNQDISNNYALYFYTEIIDDKKGTPIERNDILYIYDVNSNSDYAKIKMEETEGVGIVDSCFTDSEGNYWISYRIENDETHVTTCYFCKVNIEEKKIDDAIITFNMNEGYTYDTYEGWNGEMYYNLMGFVGSKVIYEVKPSYNKSKAPEYYAFDTKTKEKEKLSWNEDKISYKYGLINCGSKNYVYTHTGDTREKKFSLYELNSDLSLPENPVAEKDVIDWVEFAVRGNKIYFELTDNYKYGVYDSYLFYFDSTTNTFSETKKVTQFGELK